MIYQVKGISGNVWSVCGCARVCAGVRRCAQVCAGVHGCAWVDAGVCGCVYAGAGGCARVWVGGCGCAWVCACVRDEFSEFLLENRVPTSADFNTYPIGIF